MTDQEINIAITDNTKQETCSKCGFTGHKAEECEYPFYQGHKLQQKRLQDWSYLNGKVVGAE